VCKGHFTFKPPFGEKYSIDSIFASNLKARPTMREWLKTQKVLINNNFVPKFAENFNRRGNAFSFNLMEVEKLLRVEK
jgi:hypothetical protein